MAKLEALAPAALAEPWDKVGLQLGGPDWPVRTAMLCIDLTEQVMAEARQRQVQLIVAYHPPLFEPLERLTADTPRGRVLLAAAGDQIAVYSPHTALDAAVGGVNDWLARAVGKGRVSPIRPAAAHAGSQAGGTGDTSGPQLKLVVFVPAEDTHRVRMALAKAGAGRIGHYTACSFVLAGEGTFQGDETTHPAVGKAGRFERVPEQRMEMVLPADHLGNVVAALRKVHPYEEPAFDVYPLAAMTDTDHGDEGGARDQSGPGQGRVVTLDGPVSLDRLVQGVKRHLGVSHLQIARPSRGRPFQRIGVCAGAGGSLLKEAGPIDAFITGEMRHHDILAATAAGPAVILAGHTHTERPYLKVYRQKLVKACQGDKVEWILSRRDRAPGVIE